MKNTIIVTSMLLLIMAFIACKKDKKDDVKKVSEPSLHIHKPVGGTTYHSGDTVPVKVHFMDDDELHEYHVKVTNKTMTTEVLHLHGHTHKTSHTVDTFVVVSASVHTNYEMTAKVSNHNGKEARDTVKFHVHH